MPPQPTRRGLLRLGVLAGVSAAGLFPARPAAPPALEARTHFAGQTTERYKGKRRASSSLCVTTRRLAMSQGELSPQKLQEIRELAAGWGKIVARRALGESAPGEPIDLWAMERIAAAAAAGLTEGTLAVLLEQQAQTLGPQRPCPDCGRLCAVAHEDRPLAVQGGQLTPHEPACHCPDCRRDFFPPAAAPAP
jgi:hypothetical protein